MGFLVEYVEFLHVQALPCQDFIEDLHISPTVAQNTFLYLNSAPLILPVTLALEMYPNIKHTPDLLLTSLEIFVDLWKLIKVS